MDLLLPLAGFRLLGALHHKWAQAWPLTFRGHLNCGMARQVRGLDTHLHRSSDRHLMEQHHPIIGHLHVGRKQITDRKTNTWHLKCHKLAHWQRMHLMFRYVEI